MDRLFHTILIANRGEIACRIIRTARALGIRSVAVYSDADRHARFVALADEAWHLGPAPARDSYLNSARILSIAEQSGAHAIHPGYGFLSENAEFATACAKAGIVFIGPPSEAIAAMGSKAAAKTLMEKAGVPLLPGYHGLKQDLPHLEHEAARIGYPLLIKASAGGGGKGMRIVEQADNFAAALAACQREALSSFGDASVVLEKYLSSARHVEIQIFADTHGAIVYLFERDCSVQRRHQKIIEEAPAPHLPLHTRRAMGEAACAAARAVGYAGAGTVEFILDTTTGVFYFMEMNTRLQVEHPVTEMITGEDLVAWQIKVAAGYPLPKQQDELTLTGHAFEARLYAEDPDRHFLPSTGTLYHVKMPEENRWIRLDSGIVQGDSLSPFYDPMIAKLIVWGEDRTEARTRLDRALADCQIAGVNTNIRFLRHVINHPEFINGHIDTAFISRHQENLHVPSPPAPLEYFALIALADILAASHSEETSPWHTLTTWRLNSTGQQRFYYRHHLHSVTVMATPQDTGWHMVVTQDTHSDPTTLYATGYRQGTELSATLNGHRLTATVLCQKRDRILFIQGERYLIEVTDPYAIEEQTTHNDAHLKAPMPGRIVTWLAAVGTPVTQGSPLIVLEAMKMEHTITAPTDGVINAFYFEPGEQVNEGEDLIDFKATS